VLLVEDNPDSNAALELFLRSHGYDVMTAFDGEQAIERLRAGPRPSVVLLDVMMPGKDGNAFRREQLADPALASIPVIVFSGAYDVGGIAERLGVRDYLTKPVAPAALIKAVRKALERQALVASDPKLRQSLKRRADPDLFVGTSR